MNFIALFIAIGCSFVGERIGKPKGRGVQGRLLGFFLGPIGLIIIYYLAPKADEDSATTGSDRTEPPDQHDGQTA